MLFGTFSGVTGDDSVQWLRWGSSVFANPTTQPLPEATPTGVFESPHLLDFQALLDQEIVEIAPVNSAFNFGEFSGAILRAANGTLYYAGAIEALFESEVRMVQPQRPVRLDFQASPEMRDLLPVSIAVGAPKASQSYASLYILTSSCPSGELSHMHCLWQVRIHSTVLPQPGPMKRSDSSHSISHNEEEEQYFNNIGKSSSQSTQRRDLDGEHLPATLGPSISLMGYFSPQAHSLQCSDKMCVIVNGTSDIIAWGEGSLRRVGCPDPTILCPLQEGPVSGITTIESIYLSVKHLIAVGPSTSTAEKAAVVLVIEDSVSPPCLTGSESPANNGFGFVSNVIQNIDHVAIGQSHSLIKLSNGSILAFGEASRGQLSLPPKGPGADPICVTGIPSRIMDSSYFGSSSAVKRVFAWGDTSFALTQGVGGPNDLQLWSWGSNSPPTATSKPSASGLLGHSKNLLFSILPKRVPLPPYASNITHIHPTTSCTHRCTIYASFSAPSDAQIAPFSSSPPAAPTASPNPGEKVVISFGLPSNTGNSKTTSMQTPIGARGSNFEKDVAFLVNLPPSAFYSAPSSNLRLASVNEAGNAHFWGSPWGTTPATPAPQSTKASVPFNLTDPAFNPYVPASPSYVIQKSPAEMLYEPMSVTSAEGGAVLGFSDFLGVSTFEGGTYASVAVRPSGTLFSDRYYFYDGEYVMPLSYDNPAPYTAKNFSIGSKHFVSVANSNMTVGLVRVDAILPSGFPDTNVLHGMCIDHTVFNADKVKIHYFATPDNEFIAAAAGRNFTIFATTSSNKTIPGNIEYYTCGPSSVGSAMKLGDSDQTIAPNTYATKIDLSAFLPPGNSTNPIPVKTKLAVGDGHVLVLIDQRSVVRWGKYDVVDDQSKNGESPSGTYPPKIIATSQQLALNYKFNAQTTRIIDIAAVLRMDYFLTNEGVVFAMGMTPLGFNIDNELLEFANVEVPPALLGFGDTRLRSSTPVKLNLNWIGGVYYEITDLMASLSYYHNAQKSLPTAPLVVLGTKAAPPGANPSSPPPPSTTSIQNPITSELYSLGYTYASFGMDPIIRRATSFQRVFKPKVQPSSTLESFEKDRYPIPASTCDLLKAKRISTTRSATSVLCENGDLYVWGITKSDHRRYSPMEIHSEPTLIASGVKFYAERNPIPPQDYLATTMFYSNDTTTANLYDAWEHNIASPTASTDLVLQSLKLLSSPPFTDNDKILSSQCTATLCVFQKAISASPSSPNAAPNAAPNSPTTPSPSAGPQSVPQTIPSDPYILPSYASVKPEPSEFIGVKWKLDWDTEVIRMDQTVFEPLPPSLRMLTFDLVAIYIGNDDATFAAICLVENTTSGYIDFRFASEGLNFSPAVGNTPFDEPYDAMVLLQRPVKAIATQEEEGVIDYVCGAYHCLLLVGRMNGSRIDPSTGETKRFGLGTVYGLGANVMNQVHFEETETGYSTTGLGIGFYSFAVASLPSEYNGRISAIGVSGMTSFAILGENGHLVYWGQDNRDMDTLPVTTTSFEQLAHIITPIPVEVSPPASPIPGKRSVFSRIVSSKYRPTPVGFRIYDAAERIHALQFGVMAVVSYETEILSPSLCQGTKPVIHSLSQLDIECSLVDGKYQWVVIGGLIGGVGTKVVVIGDFTVLGNLSMSPGSSFVFKVLSDGSMPQVNVTGCASVGTSVEIDISSLSSDSDLDKLAKDKSKQSQLILESGCNFGNLKLNVKTSSKKTCKKVSASPQSKTGSDARTGLTVAFKVDSSKCNRSWIIVIAVVIPVVVLIVVVILISVFACPKARAAVTPFHDANT